MSDEHVGQTMRIVRTGEHTRQLDAPSELAAPNGSVWAELKDAVRGWRKAARTHTERSGCIEEKKQGGQVNKAAQALGRLAAGKPKNYSTEEIARRSKILAGINERKRKASKARKRRMPNAPAHRPEREQPKT